MAIDWETKVGAPLVATFGDPAIYTPASGTGAYDVTGVFDSQFKSTAGEDEEAPTTDFLPVFGVNSRQFKAPPVQNDKVYFPPQPAPAIAKWFWGKTYIVRESRPDGHGVFHLALNEV